MHGRDMYLTRSWNSPAEPWGSPALTPPPPTGYHRGPDGRGATEPHLEQGSLVHTYWEHHKGTHVPPDSGTESHPGTGEKVPSQDSFPCRLRRTGDLIIFQEQRTGTVHAWPSEERLTLTILLQEFSGLRLDIKNS